MKRKDYEKPTMIVEELQDCCDILAVSNYTTTTGLNAMDDDEDLGDETLLKSNSLRDMGADEDLE